MKLRNISKSKYEFSIKKEGESKPHTFAVNPGAELVIEDDHPDSMKLLAKHYPNDWVAVEEKKLSKEELKAELAKREAEEKAEKAKAEADAKAKKDAEKGKKEDKE